MNASSWGDLKWAYSPCPNDTYIFGLLALGKLPGVPPINEPELADIGHLNAMAIGGEMDVIKISAAAYPFVNEEYQILPCGGAMGYGVGPLLVAREAIGNVSAEMKVAIPGLLTTANALLSIFYPQLAHRKECLFSEIETIVQTGATDLGLLIHEGRFTYGAKGLQQVADLGKLWEVKYGLPLPLGVILVRRSLPDRLKQMVRVAIGKSLDMATRHEGTVVPYVGRHAQSMDPKVQRQHIELYVNALTKQMGELGKKALETLWSTSPKGEQIQNPFL